MTPEQVKEAHDLIVQWEHFQRLKEYAQLGHRRFVGAYKGEHSAEVALDHGLMHELLVALESSLRLKFSKIGVDVPAEPKPKAPMRSSATTETRYPI